MGREVGVVVTGGNPAGHTRGTSERSLRSGLNSVLGFGSSTQIFFGQPVIDLCLLNIMLLLLLLYFNRTVLSTLSLSFFFGFFKITYKAL